MTAALPACSPVEDATLAVARARTSAQRVWPLGVVVPELAAARADPRRGGVLDFVARTCGARSHGRQVFGSSAGLQHRLAVRSRENDAGCWEVARQEDQLFVGCWSAVCAQSAALAPGVAAVSASAASVTAAGEEAGSGAGLWATDWSDAEGHVLTFTPSHQTQHSHRMRLAAPHSCAAEQW